EREHTRVMIIIDDREGGGRSAQGGTQRDILATQIEIIPGGIGQLHEGADVTRNAAVASANGRFGEVVLEPVVPEDIRGDQIGAGKPVTVVTGPGVRRVWCEGEKQVEIPRVKIKRRRTIEDIICTALSNAWKDGEVGGNIAKSAVGSHQADIQSHLAAPDRVIGVEQAEITGPRCGSADEAGES